MYYNCLRIFLWFKTIILLTEETLSYAMFGSIFQIIFLENTAIKNS